MKVLVIDVGGTNIKVSTGGPDDPLKIPSGAELTAAKMAEDVKKAAAERGKKLGLSYAGALLPAEAHKLMQAGAKLVDVRTKPELLYVGKAPGSIAVEWQTYPGNRENPVFRFDIGGIHLLCTGMYSLDRSVFKYVVPEATNRSIVPFGDTASLTGEAVPA